MACSSIRHQQCYFAWLFKWESIYVSPEWYIKAKEREVCKLKRSSYGFKQVSRKWIENRQLNINHIAFNNVFMIIVCLFWALTIPFSVTCMCWDVLISDTNKNDIFVANRFLYTQFTIKDICCAKYFHGLEIARFSDSTYVKQVCFGYNERCWLLSA